MKQPPPEILFRYLLQRARPPMFQVANFELPEDHPDGEHVWEYELAICLN